MATVKMFNRVTGDTFEVDTVEAKNRRKRRRITAWVKYYSDGVNRGKDRSKPYDALFITLTYETLEKYDNGQIRSYIKKIKERLGSKLLSYAWVCENQKRGVPHYHIILIVRKNTKVRKPDKGDWAYGMSNIQRCIKGLFYIISYCKKEFDSALPKGARCFAIFARGEIKKWVRIDTLPNWVVNHCIEEFIKIDGLIRKISGGWIINGIPINTPYQVRKNIVTGNPYIY
jgi:hypothetical protein